MASSLRRNPFIGSAYGNISVQPLSPVIISFRAQKSIKMPYVVKKKNCQAKEAGLYEICHK
jgi:hypothetical protein